MISIEPVIKRERCNPYCNACVEKEADFMIAYGTVNKTHIMLCKDCLNKLQNQIKENNKDVLS